MQAVQPPHLYANLWRNSAEKAVKSHLYLNLYKEIHFQLFVIHNPSLLLSIVSLFTILTIAGKPQRGGDEYYNEQEYADQYDYDEDEEMPINDLDYSNTQVSIQLVEL